MKSAILVENKKPLIVANVELPTKSYVIGHDR